MYEDWGLIEASFTAQYGIRLRAEEEMSWSEFSTLLAGIMPETPLGQIITIRSENDKDTLKHFTPAQHKIRNEWRSKFNQKAKMDPKVAEQQLKNLQQALKQVFS